MFNIFKAVGRDRSSICGRKMDSSPTRASDDTGRRTKKKGQCAKCGATETKWHSPVPTTEWAKDWGRLVLSLCHAKQKERDIDKEGKKDKYANCTCSVCGGSNLPVWKTASIYLSCWEERNSDEYFRKQRDRRDCWHCCRRFQKQADKPVSNKEWRYVRYWHPLLKEWICSLSRVKGRDGGCFGITISHLKDLEMRCEDCNTLYAINWTTLGQSLLDRFQDITLTRDRITCGNCYQIRHTSSLKKVKGKTKPAQVRS